MKTIFKEAHKMTREMVKEYNVDYQAQFGLNLSYLLENKEEKEMELKQKIKNTNVYSKRDQQITLANGSKGQWLAIVEDFDPKFEYKRDFLEEDEIVRHIFCYNVKEGNIYNWDEGKGQKFGIIENNELYEISKQDVNNILNSRRY